MNNGTIDNDRKDKLIKKAKQTDCDEARKNVGCFMETIFIVTGYILVRVSLFQPGGRKLCKRSKGETALFSPAVTRVGTHAVKVSVNLSIKILKII